MMRKQSVLQMMAIIVCSFGCILTATAMVVKPTGEIHGSVITAFGLCLAFSATLLGFEFKFK